MAAAAAAVLELRRRQEQRLRSSRAAAAEFEQYQHLQWRPGFTTHNLQIGDGGMDDDLGYETNFKVLCSRCMEMTISSLNMKMKEMQVLKVLENKQLHLRAVTNLSCLSCCNHMYLLSRPTHCAGVAEVLVRKFSLTMGPDVRVIDIYLPIVWDHYPLRTASDVFRVTAEALAAASLKNAVLLSCLKFELLQKFPEELCRDKVTLYRELDMKKVINEAIARRNIAEASSRCNDRDNEKSLFCRICHVSTPTTDTLINLGCDCKLHLGRAHTSCAQKWFQRRGHTLCEICKKVARNVQIPLPPSLVTTPSLPHRYSLPFPVATPSLPVATPSLPTGSRSSIRVDRQREEIQNFARYRHSQLEETVIEELYTHCPMCRSTRMCGRFAAVILLFLVLGTILGLCLRDRLKMRHY